MRGARVPAGRGPCAAPAGAGVGQVARVYCTARTVFLVATKSMHSARDAHAWVSVNFRKFSPCMAHAACARGFDSLPSLSDVGTAALISFR